MRALTYQQRKKLLGHGKLAQLGKAIGEERRFMSSVFRNDAGRYAPDRVRAAQNAIAGELEMPRARVFGKQHAR